MELFFKGLLIGFSIAMPVGPVALLCIRYALTGGWRAGLLAGLGAALADALFGALAAFGMGLIVPLVEHYFLWIEALGAAILCWMGVHNIRLTALPPNSSVAPNKSLFQIFLSTFFLTLTNPITLLAFAAVYAAFGICCHDEPLLHLLILTAGVLLGSAAWWLLLGAGAALAGKRWSVKPSPWLNRISGAILLLFGLLATLDVLTQIL